MLFLALGTLGAQETDPVTDRVRYELAAAQRDYVIAKQQLDAATVRLREKLDLAQKACAAHNAAFDVAQFVCSPKATEQQR